MKKKIYLVCMLIVMSSAFTTSTFAQIGSGMFTTDAQYITSETLVKYNFEHAIFGTELQARRVYRKLDNTTQDQIMLISMQEMSNQMGEQFHPEHPDDYIITYDKYQYSTADDFWNQWEDSYIIDGKDYLDWGDPRNFKLNRGHPDKEYLIATVTNKATGHFFKCRANCGNVLRLRNGITPPPQPQRQQVIQQPVQQVVYQQKQVVCCTTCKIDRFEITPPQTGPSGTVTLWWDTSCPTVDIEGIGTNLVGKGHVVLYPDQTTTFVLTTPDGQHAATTVTVVNANPNASVAPPKKNHTLRTIGYVLGGAAIIVGGYYGIKALKGDSHTQSGSYNNTFQGGSGGTTTTGGEGSQNTW